MAIAYVRVHDNETRFDYSVVESAVEKDIHTVLEAPGADEGGNPFPASEEPVRKSASKTAAEKEKS